MGYLRELYGQSGSEFISAFIEGVKLFAWWKEGEVYVGTTGTTLKQAKLDIVNELAFDCDREELLQKIEDGRL